MDTTIHTKPLEELFLDPKNPRLGRHRIEMNFSQQEVLEEMKQWTLDELVVSFLESGFWPQEALIAVKEQLPGQKGQVLVVIEGNRRLAALKLIHQVRIGEETSQKWRDMISPHLKAKPKWDLENIPYILKSDRRSVSAYLGFRHVTGIKEWSPTEKAQFITYLIEDEGLDYEAVRRRIGSKAPTVRQNYIAYRLLLQMEAESGDDRAIDVGKVEQRFSVLYLSLRTPGVQQYLGINVAAEPSKAKRPVPKNRIENVVRFSRWLFGDAKHEPIVDDSRQVDEFGRVLESPSAVQYLERADNPSFAVARRFAGTAETEVAEHIERAADEVEEALKAVHQHRTSKRIQGAVRRLGADVFQLLSQFPSIKAELVEGAV